MLLAIAEVRKYKRAYFAFLFLPTTLLQNFGHALWTALDFSLHVQNVLYLYVHFMPKHRILIFIFFVVAVYGGANAFVFFYGWSALGIFPVLQCLYLIGFLTIAPMFLVARIVERFFKNHFVSFLLWVGSFWLAMLTYLVLGIFGITAITSLVREFVPHFGMSSYFRLAQVVAVFVGAFAFSAHGWRNARHPAIRKLEYVFPKGNGKGGEFHIVAATDIHLGTMIGKKRFGRFVRDVNALKPDAIFLVGDTIDEDIEPVIKQDIGTSIRKLHAPLGVFAVNGNHEHI